MASTVALLDDDPVFVETLARRLQKHGFDCSPFVDVDQLLAAKQTPYRALVLDMNLGDQSVLPHLSALRALWPDAKILLLTGYASIASTVAAIKQGADDCLTKPLDLKQLLSCLNGESSPEPAPTLTPLSPAQLEWEHIQRVLQDNNGNVSAAARALGMHRRTLQRKLQKKPNW